MWVARTIALAEDWRDRSLAGRRRVRPWYEYDDQSTDRFGMSEDQFRAYRQTGMYGGYRVAFRKWPGMTVLGDGWTPGPTTLRLAKWLDEKLGAARPSWPFRAGDGDDDRLSKRSAKLGLGKEHRWWLRQWNEFDQGGRGADENTLPRRKDDFAIRYRQVDLLKPLMFGGDRRETASRSGTEVAKARATNHIEVCEHLGRAFANDHTISLLPRFSRLADAGMEAMDLIAKSLQNDSRVKLADVAALPEAARVCDELMAAAGVARRCPDPASPHRNSAPLRRCDSECAPIECLRACSSITTSGGGLRWFVLRNGWVEPRHAVAAGSSRYRFRLWSLCRLATQCGVLRNMPSALRMTAGRGRRLGGCR